MPRARTLPSVIGPTENALRALLVKVLSTTRIKTYAAWVILNAASNRDVAGEAWLVPIADALKVGLAEVEGVLADLRSAGFFADDGTLSAGGGAELSAARSAVSAMTARLVDGIGAEEQAITCAVLDRVRGKADELLLAAP